MSETEKIILAMRKQADYFMIASEGSSKVQRFFAETSAELIRSIADDIESGDYLRCLDAEIFDEDS